MNPPEIRFLCPHCRQKLACEDGYTGWQIQCPACQGAVIVPLAFKAQPAAGLFFGPTPLPSTATSRPASAAAPMGRWRQFGILAGAAILFGGVFLLWMMRWFQGEWPWSRRVTAFEIQIWFGLGVLVFSLGVSYAGQFTDSVSARIAAGCIVPVLVAGFCWSALGMLAGGCGAGCSSKAGERAAGTHALFVSLLWFGGTAFLWAVMYGWLYALKRR